MPRTGAWLAIVGGIALALVLAAFVATGGLQLERTTKVLIAYMLAGGALTAAALVRRPRTAATPLHGGFALAAVALLAALTALSIIWSVAPSDSWFEAERTLGYLAVFAAGLALARLAPARWSACVTGIALACVALSAWAVLTKVFPATLAAEETYARLREPFAYWNSVGLMAAMGVPPLLWLAVRRSGHAALNALAWPALVIVLVALMLAYSRGSLVALAAGLVAWFVIVPLRLRALAALAAATAGTGLLMWWVFNQDGLTTDDAPMVARVDAGHEFGALLLVVCVATLATGLIAQFAASQRPPVRRARQLVGGGALGVLALVPIAVVIALATAPGGIDGQVSKAWHQLTDVNARTPANTPNRLVATSSVRARYWDEALKIHSVSPWVGTGAGSYSTARTRFRTDQLAVRQAHGYVVQTLADLGWVGLAVSLLALFAWLASAARTLGIRRRDRRLPWDAERVGLASLAVVVLVFGVHSTIDWTWFVPANAACALLCAGWIAGRGPLRARLGLVAAPTEPEPVAVRRGRRRLPVPRVSGAWAAAALVLVLALCAAWSAWQPVRALHASNAAFDRLDAGAPAAAAAIARIEAERNPLSVDPLFDLAAIEQARGRTGQAQAALERAVRLQPANADTWSRLGELRLSALGDPRGALRAFKAAYFLDPHSPQTGSDVLQASRALQSG
ncbi:MAG: hypothetical protein QOK21_293 [Solirubrobacteraceae bacterium]|nr:hypothetical protein [Solirubrobacteraceae bacterium]